MTPSNWTQEKKPRVDVWTFLIGSSFLDTFHCGAKKKHNIVFNFALKFSL